MVKVGKIQSTKLPAFTLMESVVAVTIIAVLVGLSTMIYSNIMQAQKPFSFHQSKLAIDHQLQKLRMGNDPLLSQTLDFDTFTIDQKVAYHNGNKALYQVDFAVQVGSEVIWTENHLIIDPVNE